MKSVSAYTAKFSTAVRKTTSQQKWVSWLLIFLAIVLRTRQYLFNRSLWGDEAMLALNIVNRRFVDLFKPLDYFQGAPLGFLYAEKICVKFFGNHDYILRLFPLLTGIAAVFIMAWLARRIFPGWTGLAALGLFTFSWQSIYYASEAKQYGCDVLFTLILLSAACLCSGPQVPRRNWLWLLAAGTLALWMSHPSLFIIIAIVAVIGFTNLRDKKWQNLGWLSFLCLCWGIHFLGIYYISLRNIAASKMLHNYWQKAFMPLPPWMDWSWFSRSVEMIFKYFLNIHFVLGLQILLIGVFSMFRKNRKTTSLWLIPILAVLLASGLSKYPFWTRFLLFSLPMFVLFLAAGMETMHSMITRDFQKTGFLLSAVIIMLIFWQPVTFSMQKLKSPENKNDIKSVLAYLRTNRQAHDTIYIHYASEYPFRYYARFYGMQSKKAVIGKTARESASPLLKDVNKLAGRSRVWFLFANRYQTERFDQKKTMLEYLDRLGLQIKFFSATGAELYLYDLSRH